MYTKFGGHPSIYANAYNYLTKCKSALNTFQNWTCKWVFKMNTFLEDNWHSSYEESVVDKFKSNLLLMIFWLHIINYNS